MRPALPLESPETAPEGDELARYDFVLPRERIAQEPAEPRDGARLLGVERGTGRWRDATVTRTERQVRTQQP